MTEGPTVSVHRCRFVDFTPSAITALCLPPLPLPLPSVKGKKRAANRAPQKYGTLAVGRANGNIELCEWTGSGTQVQAPQAWVVRKTFSGPNPSKVDSLAFSIRYPHKIAEDGVPSCSDLRLFSTAGGSDLVEWDIENSCIRRTVSSQGGSIWAVTPNPASTLLALGCEDGAVRLLSIENDGLNHLRRLDRAKNRILSIAWGPPVPRQSVRDKDSDHSDDDDDDENDWTDSWLVTGCSDSSLRKWDIATGRVLDRMGTDKLRGERTLVWTVGVLGDGTIVSGDSMGLVKFWDPHTCTQLESFQGHAADVLCLTISPEDTVVYTSGVDQKVAQFSLVKTTRPSDAPLSARPSSRWVQTSSRRLHSHDVRALAIWPPHTTVPSPYQRTFPVDFAPILLSGGLDMSVVTTPAALAPNTTATRITNPLATSTAATFEESYHRRLAYSAGPCSAPAVHLARQARLLLCMRDTSVTIWRILPKPVSTSLEFSAGEHELGQEGGWERVLDMDFSVRTNLVASAISDNGQWIAVSDWYETKLFRVGRGTEGELKPRRVRELASVIQSHLPGSPAPTGASVLTFTPDSSRLILATSASAYIVVFDLGMDGQPPRVLRRFEQHRLRESVVGDRVIRGRKGAPDADGDEQMDDDAANTAQSSDDDADASAPITESKLVSARVTRMAVSADGQWLATTDDRHRTHVFNLDSIQHHTILPSFPQPVHALAFDPAHPHTLVLGFPQNALQVYDVEARAFPRWARALGRALPAHFTQLHDPLLGAAFDPAGRAREALFWGATWLCRVQLDAHAYQGADGGPLKRRRSRPPPPPSVEDGGPSRFKVITHYRPILFVDYIAPAELVVVERPLVDVLAKLPPAYFKSKYGAS